MELFIWKDSSKMKHNAEYTPDKKMGKFKMLTILTLSTDVNSSHNGCSYATLLLPSVFRDCEVNFR